MLQAEGFDKAIIGVGCSFGRSNVLVYDTQKIIDILVGRDEMTEEEAREYFEFNILGSYNGPGMPVFVDTQPEKMLDGMLAN